MVLSIRTSSEMRVGESNSRRGGLLISNWGNMRLDIPTLSTLLLLLFQLLLAQNSVVGGFPTEDRISQAVARAALVAAMNSEAVDVGDRSHHNQQQEQHHPHHGKLMRAGESEIEDEEGMRMELSKMGSSLPRLEAVELLLRKAAVAAAAKAAAVEEEEVVEVGEDEQQEEEAAEEERNTGHGRGRALWSEDFQKRASATSELCRTSATLQCGKRILTLAEGQEKGLSIHMKCDLRDDFLKCIGRAKNDCLELAESSILPELPPKEMIKAEQSKLWNVLWTAGGCILSN